MRLLSWVAITVLSFPAFAAPVPAWRLARSEHFEIYAQASDQRAAAILRHFEQLRAFFQASEWKSVPAHPNRLPVRVIAFASPDEYQPYRLRPTADGYYIGSGDRDYIVVVGTDPQDFGMAAHEYVHLILRASGLDLPPWLKEGLAELYSTLRMDDRGVHLGGPLPGRLQTLRRRTWMSLAELTAFTDASLLHQERRTTDLFYAQSWALTQMLALSPDYAPGFHTLLPRFPSGSEALTSAFAKPEEALLRDLHAWVEHLPPPIQLPEVAMPDMPVATSDVSPLASRLLLAQLLLEAGEFDRAEVLFAALSNDAPESADVSAALGMIALHKGDLNTARSAWKRAIDQGVSDAALCFRYAILADQAGLGPDDIRPALERAVALQPNFDDARYQLALLEKNAGHYESALREFQAIKVVSDPRAFAYWLALADTFNELGRREEAQSAAARAAEHATSSAERSRAAEQTYMAQTDLGVQFTRDSNGRVQLATARTPHQKGDWNPFIEPQDDIHRVQGALREIDCGKVATIRVEAAGKLIALVIPNLQQVQMRHAPPEFVCGPQTPPVPVIVDYARTQQGGVVRGMDFTPKAAP